MVPARFLDVDIYGQLTHFLQGMDESEDSRKRVQVLQLGEPWGALPLSLGLVTVPSRAKSDSRWASKGGSKSCFLGNVLEEAVGES